MKHVNMLYSWLCLLIVGICISSCVPDISKEKVVVLTFDDAVISHLDYVAPLLKEKGFGATFFISYAWMKDTTHFLTWEEVAEIHRMGFEIGNHTWTHEPLHTDEAVQRMDRNLARIDSALASQGVPKPVSFAYTGNHYSPAAVKKIRDLGYRFARRGMQPEIPYGKIARGPLYNPQKNHRLVIPTTADAYPEWTLDHFKTIIDRAEEGKAIILQFHGVPDIAHPWVHTDPELFAQCMDYLEESGIRVIAMKDLDVYFDIQEVDDPALHYTHGVPGGYNPCPQEGDVWVLAGQSNMQGAGRTPDTLVDQEIWMMGLDDLWCQARSPIHRIYEAIAPAYLIAHHELYGLPTLDETRERFLNNVRKSKQHPIGGVGPGIYFARHLHATTGIPVGLIPCALGGSTIDQWDPRGKARGDSSLYGAMLGRIRSGGTDRIKGLVWYQGESEALTAQTESYEEKLLYLVDSFREDLGRPELPILIVQIGRMINRDSVMGRNFERIREIQRMVVNKRRGLYLTSGMDLELDDCIHLSSRSNEQMGARLGEIALSHVYGIQGHGKQIKPYSLELKKDPLSGSPYMLLRYTGVSGALQANGNPSGFELRFDHKSDWAFMIPRVETDPDNKGALRLYLSQIPEQSMQLVCGSGLNPPMNITDSLNMPIPAFGPLEIDFIALKKQTLLIQ